MKTPNLNPAPDSGPDIPPPWWKRALLASVLCLAAATYTNATITDDATPFGATADEPAARQHQIDDGPDPFGVRMGTKAIACWDLGMTCRLQAMDSCEANDLEYGGGGVTTFADGRQQCDWSCTDKKGKLVFEGNVPCVRRPADWYLTENVTP